MDNPQALGRLLHNPQIKSSHPWLAGLAAPVGSPEVTDMPTNPHS